MEFFAFLNSITNETNISSKAGTPGKAFYLGSMEPSFSKRLKHNQPDIFSDDFDFPETPDSERFCHLHNLAQTLLIVQTKVLFSRSSRMFSELGGTGSHAEV